MSFKHELNPNKESGGRACLTSPATNDNTDQVAMTSLDHLKGVADAESKD
jgi:hypothetical protein